MTKEDFIFKLHCNTKDQTALCELLDEFFKSNVVIPKGENRHLYADVLHEWIEGAEIQRSFNLESTWVDVMKDSHLLLYGLQVLRIKPQEPIYEWQWYYIDSNSGKAIFCTRGANYFATEEEAEMFRCKPVYKIEETKRERK